MLSFIPEGKEEVEFSHSQLSTGAEIAVAYPKAGTTIGLVMIPDVHGMRPLVDETITQLASNGIAVIAVDPFGSRPDISAMDRDGKLAHVSELDDNAQCANFLAAGQILRTKHNCAHVSLIGFCIGGMYAYKCAGAGEFDHIVACYGMITLPPDWQGSGQRQPMEYLSADSASPILVIQGDQDYVASDENLVKLQEVLGNPHHKEMGSELILYPGDKHGFIHDPEREEYNETAAKDAWTRIIKVVTNS
jgi:carboxymethylenebutenolidase